MLLRPSALRSRAAGLKYQPCIFCQSRQFISPVPRHTPQFPLRSRRAIPKIRPWSRRNSTRALKDPQKTRNEADKHQRTSFYKLVTEGRERLIPMKAQTAVELIDAFIATKDSPYCIKELSKLPTKEGTWDYTDLTSLAIVTCNVIDVEPKLRSTLPPSQNLPIGRALLVALCKAKVTPAILHVMGSVYHSTNSKVAADFIRGLSISDIQTCRWELEALSKEGDPEAMTLLGQFHERQGRRSQAIDLYEEALAIIEPKYDPNEFHPLSAPLTPPWIALANTYLLSSGSKNREQAKKGLEFGAFKADDPLAYYLLATHFTTKHSPDWLAYMTKAAASGYVEAAYLIGNFYVEANNPSSTAPYVKPSFLSDPKFKKFLNWLASWKPFKSLHLAQEWFQVAAKAGHKPSMKMLADWAEESGEQEKFKTWLMAMAEKPLKGDEKWPELVREANTRLRAKGWLK